MKKKIKAFTLPELIVAVTISAIILLFLTQVISDSFEEIAYSNKKTKILTNLYEIEYQIKDKKQKYLSGIILKDNTKGNGSDIILFRTIPGETGTGGYIFASVNKSNMKVDSNNSVDIIGDKVLAQRRISETELNDIETNPDNIYNYKFNSDEIFDEIKIKDFQVNLYNTGTIFEAEMYVNIDYNEKLNGESYSEIGEKKIEKIIFNF